MQKDQPRCLTDSVSAYAPPHAGNALRVSHPNIADSGAHRPRQRRACGSTALLLGVAVALTGCGASKDTSATDQLVADSENVFAELPGAGFESPGTSNTWAILLTKVPPSYGPNAERFVDELRRATGLSGAYLLSRDGDQYAAYGRHDEPGTPAAAADLQRVRSAKINGRVAFPNAHFMPPKQTDARTASAHDLRNARAEYGPDAVYTLQIGVYGRDDDDRPTARELAGFRKLAEDAVRALRAEGEDAFFYHGSQRSTVTVGVFREDEHDGTVLPPMESKSLRDTRERHPHNLFNGRGVNVTHTLSDGERVQRVQPSVLVAIPN